MFGGKITLCPRARSRAASPYLDARYLPRPPADADYPRRHSRSSTRSWPEANARTGGHPRARRVPAARADPARRGWAAAGRGTARAQSGRQSTPRHDRRSARPRGASPARSVRSACAASTCRRTTLTAGAPISAFWTIESPTAARLVDEADATPPAAALAYDFARRRREASGRPEIRLTATIDLPFAADRLLPHPALPAAGRLVAPDRVLRREGRGAVPRPAPGIPGQLQLGQSSRSRSTGRTTPVHEDPAVDSVPRRRTRARSTNRGRTRRS